MPPALSPRDVLRFAFRQGAGNALVSPPIRITDDPVSTAGQLPPGVRPEDPGLRTPLPYGTHEQLWQLPYPSVGAPAAPGPDSDPDPDPLGHALVAAFGLQRREPSNPYNDHRGYPSVRSKFPVHVFLSGLSGQGRRQYLDVYRHALLDLTTPPGPADVDADGTAARGIVLTGRFTHLPDYYRPLRGPLTELELGINLRALAVAMELYGLTGRVRLPGAGGEELLERLGLVPHGEWTLPVVVEPDGGGRPAGDVREAPEVSESPEGGTGAVTAPSADRPPAALAEVTAVNRTQATTAPAAPAAPASGPSPLRSAVPRLPGERPLSWAEVFWRRTAGRMPRRMSGMNGRRRRVPGTALTDAAAWLAAPVPGLEALTDALTVTAVVQDVDGFPDGRYRIRDGRPRQDTEDSGLAARLEAAYGYPLTVGNGCDVRHATTLWILSVNPRRLVDRFGPGGWSLAQLAAGWMTQGLCLSAAAHDLYARPARAFDEIPAQRLLGLAPDDTILLSVISGTGRFTEPVWDIRL